MANDARSRASRASLAARPWSAPSVGWFRMLAQDEGSRAAYTMLTRRMPFDCGPPPIPMTRFRRAARLLFALGVGLCAACSDAPERADGPTSSTGVLPERFAGSVHLQGALAKRESGSLFV